AFCARHDGTSLYLSINTGSGWSAEVSTASGNTGSMTGIPRLGRGYFNFYNGRLGELKTYDAALTGGTLTTEQTTVSDKWFGAPAAPDTANLTGPSTGVTGVDSSNCTITLNAAADHDYVFTPHKVSGPGTLTFTPTTRTIT